MLLEIHYKCWHGITCSFPPPPPENALVLSSRSHFDGVPPATCLWSTSSNVNKTKGRGKGRDEGNVECAGGSRCRSPHIIIRFSMGILVMLTSASDQIRSYLSLRTPETTSAFLEANRSITGNSVRTVVEQFLYRGNS